MPVIAAGDTPEPAPAAAEAAATAERGQPGLQQLPVQRRLALYPGAHWPRDVAHVAQPPEDPRPSPIPAAEPPGAEAPAVQRAARAVLGTLRSAVGPRLQPAPARWGRRWLAAPRGVPQPVALQLEPPPCSAWQRMATMRVCKCIIRGLLSFLCKVRTWKP